MELPIPGLSWIYYVLISFIVYIVYMCWDFRVFTKQGIPMNATPLPIFGTLLPMFRDGFVKLYDGSIARCGKVFGDFDGRRPVLMTVDTELIKLVFIKEHKCFFSRSTFRTGDQVSDRMLANIGDFDHWKYMRSVMSPVFSSAKLKGMMEQINKCALQMKEHLTESAKCDKSVEVNEYMQSFKMDAIASTAFGLDINAKEDPNNPFVVHGKKALKINATNPGILISFFLPFLMPLVRCIGVPLVDRDAVKFFNSVTKQTTEARQEETAAAVRRSDFLHLMMTAHKEAAQEERHKRQMSEDDLMAQALTFFVVGVDTTANSISFLAYNLACNPDKQEKLIEEIDNVVGDKDHVTDLDLNEMPYLDMCVNESLRLYPPALITDRKAEKDMKLMGINIPKGALVRVPIYHMHRYEEFYPQPDSFIPERFSAEEKKGRDPLLYMPFGAGPRQCIATRLALIEIKVVMAQILKTHQFVKAPETEVPIKLDPFGILKAVNGIWLRVAPRQ